MIFSFSLHQMMARKIKFDKFLKFPYILLESFTAGKGEQWSHITGNREFWWKNENICVTGDVTNKSSDKNINYGWAIPYTSTCAKILGNWASSFWIID